MTRLTLSLLLLVLSGCAYSRPGPDDARYIGPAQLREMVRPAFDGLGMGAPW